MMSMYIWDVNAGYLGHRQLLAEHEQLHRLAMLLTDDAAAITADAELAPWAGHQPVLYLRHQLLVAEMTLRGDVHDTPLLQESEDSFWPVRYIHAPGKQFELLGDETDEERRIPLPDNTQKLWAQHKYSVMARDPNLYKALGPGVAHGRWRDDFISLAQLLVDTLRQPPMVGQLRNALQHMWGHISSGGEALPASDGELLLRIQQQAIAQKERYLLESTALSELAVWLRPG